MTKILQVSASIILALFVSLTHAKTEVIELKHRTAAELLPVINSFMEPYERATEWGYQLIIQADDKKIEEIKQLIEQIDTPARRLLISVDTQGNSSNHDNQFGAQGRIKGKQGEVVIGDGNSNRVEIKRYSSQEQNSGVRSVQTLEGSAALVQTGQEIQQRHWSVEQNGRPQQQTSQRNLAQGFYVTATVQGDWVTLELSNQDDRLNAQQQHITETQSTNTRISGRLNEWISVSNIDAQQNSTSRDTLSRSKTYSTNNNELRIKVELLD